MRSLILLLTFFSSLTLSKGQRMEIEDYERAVSYIGQNLYNKRVFNLTTPVKWSKNNDFVMYKDYSAEGASYYKIDLKNYVKSRLFDPEKLVKMGIPSAKDLALSNVDFANDTLSITKKHKQFLFHTIEENLDSIDLDPEIVGTKNESTSPDGRWVAFTKSYNLYVRDAETAEEFQLTFDGVKDYEYGSYYGWFDKMQGEGGERPERFYVDWSPDSKFIKANLVDLRSAQKMYMLDYSREEAYRPDLYGYYRGSPGDTTMVHLTSKFFNVETKKNVTIDLPRRTHINSLQTMWTEKQGVLIANDTERGFQKQSLLRIDLNRAEVIPLFEERSQTNIDDFEFRFLEKHQKILFLSQRSGWRQLYLYDIQQDEVIRLTKGDFVVNNIEHIEDQDVIYFTASGRNEALNPYHQQLYRVSLLGNERLLTGEAAHHQVRFSPDGNFFVDSYSTVQHPTKTVLRKAEDGKIVAELTTADVEQVKKEGWKPPVVFTLKGKDQQTDIYGALWLPTHFDSTKQYPIIDHSYTGPHTQVFPKSFDRSFANQALAELGFVVVMVDGLGTTGRSKAFLNHSYKNMGKNLEDHVLAIKYLAEKFSWIDGEKVGIFGHSAGGYDAGHAMVAYPDFYKVGVASSADHDFRMEKAWWPEMYMGWPVDSTYHKVSNITMAGNLKGRLLLVHGNMDDNVNASATYKFVEALVKADKEFDLLILPSQRHGYQGVHRQYFVKKRWNYFVEHLLDKEPIWEFEWE